MMSHLISTSPDKGGGGGYLKQFKNIFFLFRNENICCDPSLEPSLQEVLMMGHKIRFVEEY